jgi:tetraacyldisaccharide 4'-kinase
MALDNYLQRLWYGKRAQLVSLFLVPLSWLFGTVVALRRAAYRSRLLRSHRVARPVIVVGNVTVGGTGKTPFTIWLAELLQARGLQVGIILRGYRGRSVHWPRHVTADMPWAEVGDEAVLLATRTSAIVIAGPDRVKDAQDAIVLGAQIVLSDDGLQHYRLHRDAEILVVDAQRGIGNGRLLPAGPLREPIARLRSVDLQVVTSRSESAMALPATGAGSIVASARLSSAQAIVGGEVRSLASFQGTLVHAVAAIGNPASFFEGLRDCGLDIQEHAYSDHAVLTREHIAFGDDAPVLMTEKDAVKCTAIADEHHWVVPLHLDLSAEHASVVAQLLDRVLAQDAQNAQEPRL